MKASELPMGGLDDPRLAIHAAGALPAWLWSADGARIIWANPVGARLFGVDRASALSLKTFGPADPRRRQVAQLAARLRIDGPLRLERLRGFGAPFGRFVTCGCTRITLSDGSDAVLIVAAEAIGRPMPFTERMRQLVEDADVPLAAFGSDGVFVGANDTARALLGFRNLSEAGLDSARDDALRTGRTETPVGLGHLVLQRVGNGADIGLIALLEPGAAPAPAVQAVHHEMPQDEHAPPFALYDEMSDFEEGDLIDASDDVGAPRVVEDLPDEGSQDQVPVELTHAPARPEAHLPQRIQSLRFLWDIDPDDRFNITSAELIALLGVRSAAALNAPWQDVAAAYASYGRMAAAIASQAAWSGIALSLPVDDWTDPLIADLSGIPSYANGEFTGYRGFGVVNDLEALSQIEVLRRGEAHRHVPQSLSAHTPALLAPMDSPDDPAHDMPSHEESFESVDTPANVVHLHTGPDGRVPELTPVENNAFNELARELSARLEADFPIHHAVAKPPSPPSRSDVAMEQSARALLDAAPSPVLVHREGHLLYVNDAFLTSHGYADPAAAQAHVDFLALEPAQTIALDWDGAPAQGVFLAPVAADSGAEDFAAILDAASDAILMFDAQGAICACNRSASKLFGVTGDELIGRDLASLFTPDTQAAINPLRERLAASQSEQSVEARFATNTAELPLKLTIGRARPASTNFYAIVQDISSDKRGEADLALARRQIERAATDKADILARISHEMRTPLGAIMGFADVMIEQRFGPLGSDRYADYLRDIKSCGERVVAIVDDLLDLSRIESGKRDLALKPQDLNDLVEQCVATMQPQANRERIIIRSSLAHPLPPIVADIASLRQIALNLIDNSIHLANPGGQVIVSTVHADSGDVLLRVRDTGHGLNDNEVASALAPFRSADDADAPAHIRLSLTRALAEANSARFTVKPAPYAGTMIEVAFPAGGVR